jgi:hypothetical protein
MGKVEVARNDDLLTFAEPAGNGELLAVLNAGLNVVPQGNAVGSG